MDPSIDSQSPTDGTLLGPPALEDLPANMVSSSDGSNLQIPRWFLDNCVVTHADLQSHPPSLIVRQAPQDREEYIRSSGKNIFQHSKDSFEIESTIYETMRTVLSKTNTTIASMNPPLKKSSGNTGPFRNDAMLLQMPYEQGNCGAPVFLQSLVEYFAWDISADLITLGMDDIQDLARHFYQIEIEASDYQEPYLHAYFNLLPSGIPRPKFPFLSIVRSISLKKASGPSLPNSSSNPLVIHIPDVDRILRSDYGAEILLGISDAIAKKNKSSQHVLLVSSSHKLETQGHHSTCRDPKCCDPACQIPRSSHRILGLTGMNSMNSAICVVPVRSLAQIRLLERGGIHCQARKNIRVIQRAFQHPVDANFLPMMEPYADWERQYGSKVFESLGKCQLSHEEVESLAVLIQNDVDVKNIQKAALAIEQRREILESWEKNIEDVEDTWSSFPLKIQTAVRDILKDDGKYRWEIQLLKLVINPRIIEEGWSDIEIDKDIQDTIKQLIDQPRNTDRKSYGVLKTGHIGGALLYGPPGTGKTHLARVLARECQVAMISVSPADIESEFVGEAEKIIKALFNLGRLIGPSIIFIDEADTLFHARSTGDRTWERSRVNQLLTEMDGLVKSPASPFVLLATNFPRMLDHAVLRRAPCKLYLGLPKCTARKEILRICLRGEKIDTGVDLEKLSAWTEGYSGSDIQTLCIQAALLCEAETVDGHVRNIKAIHFKTALARTAPTTSEDSLSYIRDFAREHDPSAWLKMLDEDGFRVNSKSSSTTGSSSVPQKRPGSPFYDTLYARHPPNQRAHPTQSPHLIQYTQSIQELDSKEEDTSVTK